MYSVENFQAPPNFIRAKLTRDQVCHWLTLVINPWDEVPEPCGRGGADKPCAERGNPKNIAFDGDRRRVSPLLTRVRTVPFEWDESIWIYISQGT